MPPCNTTNIHDHNYPDFSITLFAPTNKHPNPPRPPFTAITSTYTKLPTHTTLNIQVLEAMQMEDGRFIRGAE
eukprot:851635-Karenia_brevis.AAC.1